MKILFLVLALMAISISCSDRKETNRLWNMNLLIQNTSIPFTLELNQEEKRVTIHNATERVNLKFSKEGDVYNIPIQNYDSAITLKYTDGKLRGHWERFNKKQEYKIPLSGEPSEYKLSSMFPKNLPKQWKITFTKKNGKSKDAILLFSKGHASILTQTGDYRYLRPVLSGRTLNLYGFDGAFSFNFQGQLSEDGKSYTGMMYSGKSWNQKFTAKVDPTFKLKDAYSITKVSKEALAVCLPGLDGKSICLNKLNSRPKVIQIFGSWCPNCIDETRYIQEYRRKHNPKVDFYITSFERAPDKKTALKLLKKTKDLYEIDYPILIGAYTSKQKVQDVFKGIDNFASFPTTIYVDKAGEIVKVHSGFSGPATGKYFEEFSYNFDSILKKLQSQ